MWTGLNFATREERSGATTSFVAPAASRDCGDCPKAGTESAAAKITAARNAAGEVLIMGKILSRQVNAREAWNVMLGEWEMRASENRNGRGWDCAWIARMRGRWSLIAGR